MVEYDVGTIVCLDSSHREELLPLNVKALRQCPYERNWEGRFNITNLNKKKTKIVIKSKSFNFHLSF